MCRIINEFQLRSYRVLILDKLPLKSYRQYQIDGEMWEPVPVYDAKNTIAIRYDYGKSFLGKTVDFR